MSVQQLPSFPNTIRNLDDKPNLSPDAMKQALQQDCSTLWNKTIEVIGALNGISRESLGIYVGNTAPASVASTLATGDIYLYVPDLP